MYNRTLLPPLTHDGLHPGPFNDIGRFAMQDGLVFLLGLGFSLMMMIALLGRFYRIR